MKRALKILLSLPFLLVLGALGAYALGGFVVAPWWIKRELPHLLDKHLSATGSVGEIAINPFKLTLEARNFAMTESGGSTPAIAFDRLFVDFETSSLFRRAWTFADITLERPRVNLEADAKGALNLAKLKPKNPPPQKDEPKKDEPKSGLPRLLLQRAALAKGLVSFTDKAVSKPAAVKLEPVDFELHDLSTLPDLRGEYTLSARLPAGGALGWRGTITLAPIASAGQVEINAVKLATLWQFTQDKLLIEAPGGSAALKLAYDFRYADSQLAASARDVSLRISDVSLQQRGAAAPALTAGELALNGGTFELAQRKVQFAELALNKIAANTLIDAEGKANWAQLMAPPPTTSAAEPAAAPAKPAPGAPWQMGIAAINVADVQLSVIDQSFVNPLAVDVARIGARGGLSASIGTQTAATIDNIAVDVEGIRVAQAGAKDALVSLASVNLAGGAFDLAQKKFSVDSIRLDKLATAVTRDAKGTINLAAAFTRKTVKPSEPSPLVTEIAAIELAGGNVAFKDLSTQTPLVLDLQDIRATLKNLSSAGKTAMPIEASLQIKQGGTLRAQGTLTPEQQRASVKLEARGIALAPLAALVAQHTTLKLASGTAHARGQVDWNGQGKMPGVRYAGSAGVDTFRLDHEASGERLVAWQALAAEGIRVDSARRIAAIDDVRLNAPAGKIVIARDRSTNFANVMRKPAAAPDGAPATAASAPAAKPAGDAPFNVTVERVHVRDGELDFTDQALVLPFAAVIREFGGLLSGLSSQPGTRASVKLEGRVDEFGQAQVNGSINPFEPKVFTDLAVNFRNVAMSPLTPYSATFAGRRIASGKLSLDLQYKLNNSQLLGENKVLLEQFTLGERVESPTAINLPLDLAIALLTDSSGKIDLSVPVRGNVDEPKFAYGHLVWQAIRTVLTNIVTAPFRALASLFGSGAEKVDAIGFEAGRAQLAPPEREKLTRVAGVLKQRPQLRLAVEGRYDTNHDGAALRAAAARRALAQRQGIKLAGADDPALVNFDNARTQRAIEAMMEERAGNDSVDKFQASHEKTTGKPVSRVNPALALIGRGSADRAFYEALFSQVIALQPLEKDALPSLAMQRGTAVLAFLKDTAGVEAARIGTKPAAEVKADKASEIATALSLDVVK